MAWGGTYGDFCIDKKIVIFGSEPGNPVIVYGPLGRHCRGASAEGVKVVVGSLQNRGGYRCRGLFLRGYKAVVRPCTPMFWGNWECSKSRDLTTTLRDFQLEACCGSHWECWVNCSMICIPYSLSSLELEPCSRVTCLNKAFALVGRKDHLGYVFPLGIKLTVELCWEQFLESGKLRTIGTLLYFM